VGGTKPEAGVMKRGRIPYGRLKSILSITAGLRKVSK